MPGHLNRIGLLITDTGTGSVTANTVISSKYLLPGEAGAVDGQQYYFLLEDGNDFEHFVGTWTASGTIVSRDTVIRSKISGVLGTTKLTLSGAAQLRSIAPVLDLFRQLTRSARTSNTALGVADVATLVEITSGTFSQTFVAAATLGSGWNVVLYNSGTGDVTLDPNGSETIDTLTSFVMYPGEARLITCDGSGFNSIVLKPFIKKFTATGSNTFTKPPGYTGFDGELQAAGGSGGGGGRSTTATVGSGGGGGGGGQRIPFAVLASDVGATETVTVGAGSAGGNGSTSSGSAGSNGVAGGNTSFGAFAVAVGGARGTGGASTNASINSGAGGGSGNASSSPVGYEGGATTSAADAASGVYGGGGGGSAVGTTSAIASLKGGGSLFGGAGGGAGGGGGSATTGAAGGARGATTAGTGPSGGTGNNNAGTGNPGTSATNDGDGGGGGGSTAGGTPGVGGDGKAGGGGGGGGRSQSVNAGKGGSGGDGFAIVRGL